MLSDKMKEKDIEIKNESVGLKLRSKDAIIFKVNESIDPFILEEYDKISKKKFGEPTAFPSLLPYNNMLLNFEDVVLWYHQKELPNNGKVILSTNATSKERLNDAYVGDKSQELYTIWVNSDFSLYDIRFFPDEIDNANKAISYGPLNVNIPSDNYATLLYHVVILSRFLSLLSCKNVSYLQEDPPRKLQKSRVKKGKFPLSSYYVLKLNPTTSRREYEAKDLWTNRVHLCRGHVREYTAKRPLFGKYTGRFWIPPHVRGDKKKGIVNKDYQLEPAVYQS